MTLAPTKICSQKTDYETAPVATAPIATAPVPTAPIKICSLKKDLNQIIHQHTLAPIKICSTKTDYETNNHFLCPRFHANVKKISVT